MIRRIVVLLPLLLLLIGAAGCDFKLPEKQPKPVTETRDVAPFQEIFLSGEGLLTIRPGKTVSVEVEAEQLDIHKVSTRVVDNRLIIRTDTFRSPIPIRFQVTVTDVNKISLTGPGMIDLADLTIDALSIDARGTGSASLTMNKVTVTEQLELDLRGTTTVTATALKLARLNAKLRGSGNVTIGGSVHQQQVTLFETSTGDYRAADLDSAVATVVTKGSGNAMLRVREKLIVESRGSGRVAYYGKPSVEVHQMGTGVIEPLPEP